MRRALWFGERGRGRRRAVPPVPRRTAAPARDRRDDPGGPAAERPASRQSVRPGRQPAHLADRRRVRSRRRRAHPARSRDVAQAAHRHAFHGADRAGRDRRECRRAARRASLVAAPFVRPAGVADRARRACRFAAALCAASGAVVRGRGGPGGRLGGDRITLSCAAVRDACRARGGGNRARSRHAR